MRDQRSRGRDSTTLGVLVALFAALGLTCFTVGAAAVPADVTLIVKDVESHAPITEFTYLVSKDNAARRTDPVNERPGSRPTPSYIPLVAAGDQDSGSLSLPDGRYLVTVKAPGYKLWGEHFELPRDAGDVLVELKAHPLPLGKLVVHAFHDRRPVNAAPDFVGELAPGPVEDPLEGFEVRLSDTVGEVQADYNGDPLCGGVCLTGADGNVTIENLAPGKYEIEIVPPDGTPWIQTTTLEGTHHLDAFVTENDDGLGAIGEAVVTPGGIPTAYWYGFVQPCEWGNPDDTCPTNDTMTSGAGSISGTARTWVGWPPYDQIDLGDPVPEPYVALSNIGNLDEQVFLGRGDPDGNFTIENIPDGTYTLSIFDEQLDWIIRYVTFTIPDASGSRALDLNTPDVNGESGLAVARWFGWISGYVFRDTPPGDGIMDPGEDGIAGVDLDLRYRDGSVKDATFTDPNGYYEYPEELIPVGKFNIAEVGFGRFARTGMSLHDEQNTASVEALPQELGGGLLLNQLTAEGHRSWIDWGKREYNPGENGGITGIVYYATTRNEFNPALAAAEDYEPGIPATTVRLWGLAPGGDPGDAEDYTILLNEAETDSWSHPRSDHPDLPQSCVVRNAFGAELPSFTPDIGANCLEYPTLSNQTKDGAFDGGYAFETMVNDPVTGEPLPEEAPLPANDYVVEVVPPAYYQVIKEEDQNTDEGDDLVPQIPPPGCVGPLHLVNDPRNPAHGQQKPLCNKKLVTLEDGQNPAADFFLFTDIDDDPTTNTAAQGSWSTTESVAPPGRIFGLVADDLRFDQDPRSPWYGQPRALPNTPVGVYDYAGRRITMLHTDEHGFYDVTLPSTQTYNTPIPSGVSPGMYVLRINDPADPAFNPDFVTEPLAFDVWPGKTTYADTPVDPISGLVCMLGITPEGLGQRPEFFRVGPNPYVRTSGTAAQRELTIDGAGFGASRGTGRITLGGTALGAGAYLSWTDRRIRIRLPASAPTGPQQMLIRGASGETAPVGITIHVLGSGYNLTDAQIRHVPAEYPTIQAAVNAAADNDMVVVNEGTYNENVIMHRRVKLQGVGPGGTVGAPENVGIDDIRFTIPGSVITARNFFDREAAWNALLASLPKAGNQHVPGGAGITVVPRTTTQFDAGRNAAIDGLGIILGRGGGAGGIQVNAWARRLAMSNNILENNGGEWGGAINLGLPRLFDPSSAPLADSQNDNVTIRYNRLIGNGGRRLAGGLGIYNGAQNYVVSNNDFCSNYAVEYGGGISHFGRSPGGQIVMNRIYANESFDEGGGIMIAGENPPGLGGLGSGRVDILQNLISLNLSNDDGGGIRLLDPLNDQIRIHSNILSNNVATDHGAGIAMDDASNVQIINNTFARNSTTDTSEDRDGLPNGAGLTSEPDSPAFTGRGADGDPDYSRPRALFNNIFWMNEAFTYEPTAPDDGDGEPNLISAGTIDFEVIGRPEAFAPRFSILTDAAQDGAGNPENIVGQDPLFVAVYNSEISVSPARFSPNEIQTSLFRGDPLEPGHEGIPGNYHITAGSPAINSGVATAGGFDAPLFDIDGDSFGCCRPDRGADDFRP